MHSKPTLFSQWLCELLGTGMFVFFGTGSVFVAVLAGALPGLFCVGIVWGLAIALTISAIGAISGAHINRAITLAMWVWRGFPGRKVAPYLVAQGVGAMLASAVLLGVFGHILSDWEQEKGIDRGQAGSEASAMVLGEYFPNPAMFGSAEASWNKVSLPQAMAAEGMGTLLLVFLVFAMTDARNGGRSWGAMVPLMIGLSVTVLICVMAPLTQGGFNPARDFGPRLVAWLAGWALVAIPSPRGGFLTVYILAPILGGVANGGGYQLLRRAMARATMSEPEAMQESAELAEAHNGSIHE